MPAAINTVPTRQLGEIVLSSAEPLGGGAAFESDPYLVAGFNSVAFFANSDTPFEIQVLEACSGTGRFAVTRTLASSPVGSAHLVCDRVFPCGTHMKGRLNNLGGSQTFLALCALGIPEP